jgi:glucokinase
VDFAALAERFEATGGDIKNAVLKAAQLAIAEPGPDGRKRIGQKHFVAAIEDVLAARKVMDQSVFDDWNGSALARSDAALTPGNIEEALEALGRGAGRGIGAALWLSAAALLLSVIALVLAALG